MKTEPVRYIRLKTPAVLLGHGGVVKAPWYAPRLSYRVLGAFSHCFTSASLVCLCPAPHPLPSCLHSLPSTLSPSTPVCSIPSLSFSFSFSLSLSLSQCKRVTQDLFRLRCKGLYLLSSLRCGGWRIYLVPASHLVPHNDAPLAVQLVDDPISVCVYLGWMVSFSREALASHPSSNSSLQTFSPIHR